MERLGHFIQQAVSFEEWKSIAFGRDGPPLSHLFFADDLVFFGEATKENAIVLHRILEEFCYYSRYKVNSSKSKKKFSSNTDFWFSIWWEMCLVFCKSMI